MKRFALLTLAVLALSACTPTPPPPSVPDIQAKAQAYEEQVHREIAEGGLKPIALERPAGRPLRVLVAGDSISQGRFATLANDAYVPNLKAKLSAGGEVQLDVIGNSGYTTPQVTPQVPQHAYDLVIAELGTNDAMKENPTQFGGDYRAFLTAVRAASPTATLICAGSWQTNFRASSVDPLIASTCTDFKGRYVALNPLFNDESNRGPDKSHGVYGTSDNFHPNSKGHAAIAETIAAQLKL